MPMTDTGLDNSGIGNSSFTDAEYFVLIPLLPCLFDISVDIYFLLSLLLIPIDDEAIFLIAAESLFLIASS
jgi:hypothetical protein